MKELVGKARSMASSSSAISPLSNAQGLVQRAQQCCQGNSRRQVPGPQVFHGGVSAPLMSGPTRQFIATVDASDTRTAVCSPCIHLESYFVYHKTTVESVA